MKENEKKLLKNANFQNFYLSITTGLTSSLNSSIESFQLLANKYNKISQLISLLRNADVPKFPKNATNKESHRYSNPRFSVTTSLISSINASIKDFELVDLN